MKTTMYLRRHCIIALILLALPAAVHAQFTFTTNNGAITITGYNGPGGAVVIPDTTNGYDVTGISDFAFEDGTNLTSVNIPGSVTNIGEGPFLGCTSLTNISVNATNPSYSSKNGVLYEVTTTNLSRSVLVAYPAGLTNGTYSTSFPVPVGIADYAFAYCSSLTNATVDIPSIGNYAFTGCTGLTEVNIGNRPPASPHINVGEGAFTGCTSLSSVFIAGSVTNIKGSAFAFCTNLTVAYFAGNAPPDDGTAFYGDPDAVAYYTLGTTGWGPTFGGAPTVGEMQPIDFQWELINGSITITRYEGPSGTVTIPAYIWGYPVTSIGQQAFTLSDLTSVTIPNTVTSIGQQAFFNLISLTNVVLSDSVTNMGDYAFSDCLNLASITIPSGVTSIGYYAFALCTNLTSVSISDSVITIGEAAFIQCSSLTNISVDAANPAYSSLNGILFDKAQDTLIAYPDGLANSNYTIPNSVSSIGVSAFDSSSLFSVTIPPTVTNIGSGAFYGCTVLTNIIIAGSVTNIGQEAFAFCPNLTSTYFQGNAPTYTGVPFTQDPAITVYYLPGTTGWSAIFGGASAVLWNPQATTFTTAGNQFGFNITGPTNATIVVEACTNLADPVWLPVSTNTLSSSGISSFSDPQAGNSPSRYYRFSAR